MSAIRRKFDEESLRDYFPGQPPVIPDPPEYDKYSENVKKIVQASILFDNQWAEGLDRTDKENQDKNLRAYIDSTYHMNGINRISIKNVDQSLILEQIVKHNLTLDEIKQLQDFFVYYARNYYKIHENKKPTA